MYNFEEAWEHAEEVTNVPYSPELDLNPKTDEDREAAAVPPAGTPPTT